jgi:hypothetical protein
LSDSRRTLKLSTLLSHARPRRIAKVID